MNHATAINMALGRMLAGVKAAARPTPDEAMDATLRRLEAGIRQSGAAVRRAKITPTQDAARTRAFQQARPISTPQTVAQQAAQARAYQARLAAARATLTESRDQEPQQEQKDHWAEGVQIDDHDRGRPTWDFHLMRGHDDWRGLRMDRRDFEDLLHPLRPAALPLRLPPPPRLDAFKASPYARAYSGYGGVPRVRTPRLRAGGGLPRPAADPFGAYGVRRRVTSLPRIPGVPKVPGVPRVRGY